MPIDDPNVLLNDPDMSRDFLSDMLGTGEKKEKPPPDGKYLEGQPVVVDGLKGRPELNGRRGRLCGTLQPESNRWPIRVLSEGGGKEVDILLKTVNLRPITAPNANPAANSQKPSAA